MVCRRRLIPLLAAVLVIQSLVAALPHTHGSAVEGRAWDVVSSINTAHRCLACSVHVPVVEPAAGFGHAVAAATTAPDPVDGESSDVLSVLASASPRGPPRIV